MRKIKFRGISQRNNKFVFGSLFKADTGLTIIENGGSEMLDFHFIDKKSVGQFTGLTDKNGKEIYEGDIFHCNGVNYILRYNILGGAYTVHKIEDEDFEQFLFHCNNQLEIIGNSFENPELK